MYSIGIDSGSVATKGIVFDGQIIEHIIIPTGWSPKNACEEVLLTLLDKTGIKKEHAFIVATGYGRVSIDFADKTLTEITCHAKGAHFLNNDVRTILDIGGQDSKVIKLDNNGNVVDFLMNDKCAAGTGRFLQVMINLLGSDIKDIDNLTKGAVPESINSMCTVFAESEVISMLANGSSKESVASGILHSIANRIVTLASKVGIEEDIMFTGGLAQSNELTNIISNKLKKKVYTSPLSQLNGAIGAAVIGLNKYKRLKSRM
ncbi:acyl-CoA dehydratase activase [Gottschalkia purinilytica]|uniref:acyl-CoA dehydratase activase n=1 Tax=Gottschalkia purinilytica TaxID=1503 RepID=UPI00067E355D|nr:acyl-CoA dehydratase activase [Gottschalkia purinilytica]